VTRVRDLERAGREYRLTHDNFLPDRVRRSGRKQTRKTLEALGDGCGWVARLQMAAGDLKRFTFSLRALGFEHLEYEGHIYRHASVAAIKEAVFAVMPGRFWARLEVGERERKGHLHALAHEAPTVTHHAQETETLEELVSYVCKCSVPGDDLSAGIFLEERARALSEGYKRLPNTSFRRGIPNS
jgi:hypothetical protein